MKVEMNKEIFFEKLKKDEKINCNDKDVFSVLLEKEIIKNIENTDLANSEIKRTSIFFEKKIGKHIIDSIDTLIDI